MKIVLVDGDKEEIAYEDITPLVQLPPKSAYRLASILNDRDNCCGSRCYVVKEDFYVLKGALTIV